jgi:DNA modification methylase
MGIIALIFTFIILIPGLAFGTVATLDWIADRPTKEDKWKTKAKAFEKERDTYKAVALKRIEALEAVLKENESMRILLGWPTDLEVQKTERELALEAAKAAIKQQYPEIEFKDEQ